MTNIGQRVRHHLSPIDKEKLIATQDDLILKWVTFLLFLTVPLFVIIVSFLPHHILCTNPKLTAFASSGTSSSVYAILHVVGREVASRSPDHGDERAGASDEVLLHDNHGYD